jgi:hypothetical protein
VETHLLDGILYIRPCQREVLKSTDDGAIEGSIGRWRALDSGYLGLRIDRRGSRFAIKHACTLQKLMRVLLLMQEEPSVAADNLDAEEVVESPQVLEGELSAELGCNLL